MKQPTREEAHKLLQENVTNAYQRFHSQMVAVAMDGYAQKYEEDRDLWYITGLLHDLDFENHPEDHPTKALSWFKEWDYPEELIHAVEAHAYSYNGFSTLPRTKLAAALLATDEITGIFYAYQKLNPIPYKEMKVKSIKKRLKQKDFAAAIDRKLIQKGCDELGIDLDEHIENLIGFFAKLE